MRPAGHGTSGPLTSSGTRRSGPARTLPMDRTSGMGRPMDKFDVWTLRVRLRMTQRELAAALGGAETTVCRWERGRRPVGPLATLALTHLAQMHGATRKGRKAS